MKPLKSVITMTCLLLILVSQGWSQDSTSAAKKKTMSFLLTGNAYTGLVYTSDHSNSDNNAFTFGPTAFNPVFLWKMSNRFFFEGEVEFNLSGTEGYAGGEGLEVELEYSNVNFIINKYMTLQGGVFFVPQGVYQRWYHQEITNKFTSNPLGIGHHGFDAGTDMGFNLTGAFPAGNGRINYSVAVTNGPLLDTGDGEEGPATAGMIGWENVTDDNLNKALGARIGWLPFHNSSLEIGVSGNTAKVGATGTIYAKTPVTFYAVDLSYIKDIDPIKGTLTFRSQYENLTVGDATFFSAPEDTTGYLLSNNSTTPFFAELAYRPSEVLNKVIRRFEIAGRYSSLNNPEKAMWGTDQTQWALALDYWIKWNAVCKLSYEQDKFGDVKQPSRLIFQAVLGF